MPESPFLSVVIPCFNEEERLAPALEAVLSFFDQRSFASEVLVVENGSRDRTLEIARRFEQSDPRVRTLAEKKQGKGLAVRRGMLEARGEYRLLCDVDFSMPLGEVERFLPPHLDDFDVAIASREAPGAQRYGEPAYRHLMGRIFNGLIRLLVIPGIADTQCGFKSFRAAAAEQIFHRQTIDGLAFDVEVLAIAARLGFRIREVPIPWTFDPDSRVRPVVDTFRMVRDLLAVRRNARRGIYQ